MAKRPENDILGLAALDYLGGKKEATVMIEIDVAGTDLLPVIYLFRNFKSMPALEKIALNLCRGKILDVGAGTGIHSMWLQKRGFVIHALDSSAGMVKVMESRGVKNIHHCMLSDFQQRGFDTILFLMNGIGIAKTLKNLKSILKHAAGLLNPGGQILIESTNILYVFEQQDGSYLVPLHNRYYGEVIMKMKYNDLSSQPFKWIYVDIDTLFSVSKSVGLNAKLITKGSDDNYLACLTIS